MNVLLNIGNNDFLAMGQRPAPIRPADQQIWQTYEQHAFTLQIIKPTLNLLLKNESRRLERIVLFDTYQQARDGTLKANCFGVTLHDKDTVWFGKIIERYHSRIGDGQRRDISDFNPSLYDEAIVLAAVLATLSIMVAMLTEAVYAKP